jgi:Beta-lactamase enzyme family
VQNGAASLADWVPEFDPAQYCAFQQLSLGTGDDTTTTFSGTLPQNNGQPIDRGSVKITADPVAAVDNGNGQLTGDGVTGTIDYATGEVSLTFDGAPGGSVQLLVSETISAAIKQMMQNSDDARTDMFINRYGQPALTAFANGLGMANTQFNGYINCPGAPNHLTLDDAGHLYEGLAEGTILAPTYVQTLFSLMAGKDYDFSGTWHSLQEIITQEAPTDLTAEQIQAFSDGIQLCYKAGGYGLPGQASPDGSITYADSGWMAGWKCLSATVGRLRRYSMSSATLTRRPLLLPSLLPVILMSQACSWVMARRF